MIKIDNEYILNANESCYTLETISTVQDIESKNYGKETRAIEGYYTTIESALKGYIKSKTKKYISNQTENTLNELLITIEGLEKELKDKFKEI